jgi:hypothetical protein
MSMVMSHIAAAQSPTIAVSADKQKILIGEPLQLHFTITAADGSAVAPLHIDSIYHFEILQKSKTDTQLDGNLMRLKQTYTITSWDSGRWQIPSFQLASGHKTKSLIIDVGYTPFDVKQDYNDIKDILDVKRPQRTTWYWYVIGVALLIALFILIFPQKKKQPKAGPVSYEGAYKEALQQLEKLKKQSADEDAKRYYTTLIDIFRSYLQRRKNIQSFSKTTEDIAQQLKQINMPANQYNTMVQTLQLSDLVKFAQYQPQPYDNKTALETIKKSIVTIENSQ